MMHSAQVTITISGPQQIAVTSHTREPGHDRPAIILSGAGVITCCRAAEHVHTRAETWAHALRESERVFSRRIQWVSAREMAEPLGFAAGLVADDSDPIRTQAHGPGASRDGHADLIVRIGPLAVRCLDQQAVRDLAEAWADAARLARILWAGTAAART